MTPFNRISGAVHASSATADHLTNQPTDIRYQIVRSLIPSDITASTDTSWYRNVSNLALAYDRDVISGLVADYPKLVIDQIVLEKEFVVTMMADILRDQAMSLPYTGGTTVLIAAARLGNRDLLTLLLDQWHPSNSVPGAGSAHGTNQLNVALSDSSNRTALHYAAQADYVEPIHALVAAAGPDQVTELIAAPDNCGWTALHYASACGNLDSMRALLDLNADPNALDTHGFSPLHIAESFNRSEAMKLLSRYSNMDIAHPAPGFSALHIASSEGNPDMTTLLLDLGHPVGTVDAESGRTALHYAANGNHASIIEALFNARSDVNAQDYWCRTPLHLAALGSANDAIEESDVEESDVEDAEAGEMRDVERNNNGAVEEDDNDVVEDNAIRLLVKLGADINAQDIDGRTPLHLAAMNDEPIATYNLIERGADLHVIDFSGRNPYWLAAQYERAELADLILSAAHNRRS